MPLHVVLAAAAVVAAVPLLWWALASDRQPAAQAVARNLAGSRAALTDLRRTMLQRSASERAVQPAIESLARKGRRLTPAGLIEAAERKLLLAGLSHWGIERVLAAKFGLGLAGFGLGFLIWVGNPSPLAFLGWVLAVTLGYFGVDGILSSRAQTRQQAIQKELPDTIDQITISVEAGLGFEAALSRIAQTGTGPLAEELARTLQDIQLGVSRSEAMDKLLHRTDVEDLRRFVHAMRQAEGYGIPIAQVLRVQSAELRDKRRQRAEEQAMKIPVKIVFPVVMCIFPTLFIVILGPALIRIVQDWPS